tara:strand:- start:447 stop:689 length:243 start_codon:yes stop_codon:yes gene_type:complete
MSSKMSEIVEYVAKTLVDEPDEVKVVEQEGSDRLIIRLDVADNDMGRVIGRNGRIASAIRSLLKVAAIKEDARVGLEIGD